MRLATCTGGWDLKYQRWQEVAALPLRGGLNFLRLYAKEGTFPRIDRFRLCKIDEPSAIASCSRSPQAQHLDPLLLGEFVKEPAASVADGGGD